MTTKDTDICVSMHPICQSNVHIIGLISRAIVIVHQGRRQRARVLFLLFFGIKTRHSRSVGEELIFQEIIY
jgi:hypothetical protein